MTMPRLGLLLGDDSLLRVGRKADAVDVLVAGWTEVDPPRQAAATKSLARIRELHADSALGIALWRWISAGPGGAAGQGTRTPAGDVSKLGLLQDSDENRRAWEAMAACASGYDASYLWVATPPEFQPSSLYRRRLVAFAEARREEGLTILWQPQGLWTASLAESAAEEAGAELVWPAFRAGRIDAELPGRAWLRADGLGAKKRLDEERIWDLLDASAGGLGLMFTGPRGYTHLRIAQRLIAAEA